MARRTILRSEGWPLGAFRSLFAIVSAAAGFAFAASAAASPTWTPAVRVAPSPGMAGIAQGADIAVDGAGDAALAWDWWLGGNTAVYAMTRRRRSDTWSNPVALAQASYSGGVALDAAGDAFAVLQKLDGFPQVSVAPATTASWEDPVTLSPPGFGCFCLLQLAVNAAGDALVGFSGYTATRHGPQGQWQDIDPVSDYAGGGGPAVAVDSAGDELALWAQAVSGDASEVVASFRPVGESNWQPPVDVGGPYESVHDLQVAFDGAGNAVAVWRTQSGIPAAVWASRRSLGGSWQQATAVSNAPFASTLSFSLAANGDALVAWVSDTGARTFELPVSGGAWRDAGLSTAASEIKVATDPRGNAIAVWTGNTIPTAIFASLRPAGGRSWTQPVALGHGVSAGFGGVALDDHGGAMAVWATGLSSADGVYESDLRPDGPVLTDVQVPTRAAVGEPARFHAAARAWGAPLAGTATWDFGDGSTARGNAVRHAYTRPGNYTVSVRRADTSGAESTAQGTIRIGVAQFTNVVRPTIGGSARVGSSLVCKPGTWSGTRPIHFRFAWLRNHTQVAIGQRYRPLSGDAGSLLTCRVTATGRAPAVSATSGPVRVRAR